MMYGSLYFYDLSTQAHYSGSWDCVSEVKLYKGNRMFILKPPNIRVPELENWLLDIIGRLDDPT